MNPQIINNVSGPLKELSKEEFLNFVSDPDIKELILERVEELTPTSVVVFECLQMDSSYFGRRAYVLVGGKSDVSMSDIQNPNCRTGDLPSNFMYPTIIWYPTYKPTCIHDWEELHDGAGDERGRPMIEWSWRKCLKCGKEEDIMPEQPKEQHESVREPLP